MIKYAMEIALLMGAIPIAILVTFKRKSSRNNIFLALSLFCIWYSLLLNYLNQTHLIESVPFLFKTGNVTAYLILTFLYIYARNTFYPGVFWRNRDFLLLVPALIYAIDMIPVFMLPVDQKLKIILHNYSDTHISNQFTKGWLLSKSFHMVFRYLWGGFLMTLIIRLIIRNRYFARSDDNSYNKRLFLFIVTLTALRMPLLFPGILGAIFKLDWYNLNFVSIDLSAVLISSSIFFLATPTILYGFFPKQQVKEKMAEIVAQQVPVNLTERKEGKPAPEKVLFYFDNVETEHLILKIESYVKENSPFLNSEYSIHDLSKDIHIPVYQLSPIINQHFKSNFSTFINRYRVNYFIALCNTEKIKNFTLDTLAKECGFSNRATFTTAFKKEKNQTPGIFLKNSLPQTENIPIP